jgi:hypothetical protein
MITVTLEDKNINDVLDIVHSLRRDGYQQGTDFDFAYHPNPIDYDATGIIDYERKKYTEFHFYDEHLAMMFKLRYSGE